MTTPLSSASSFNRLLPILVLLGFATIAVWQLETTSESPVRRTEILMDSIVSMTAYGPAQHAEAGMNQAFAAMHEIDRLASFHHPDSELARFNRLHRLQPSPAFAAILEEASASFAMTQGYFDPTFSVLHQAYGFYSGNGRLPGPDEIFRCLQAVGWPRVVSEASGAFLLASGSQIDLGGIAGGFAVEAAATALRQASCPAFFIDDAGDLWMEGKKPNGTPWRVAVKDPRSENGILAYIESENPIAISTSGDYERFVTVDGRRYCHIFDPLTGRPADHYRSVTVVASTPREADIQSTTLFSMPPDLALSHARKHNLAALFLPASGSCWVTPAGAPWFRDIAP